MRLVCSLVLCFALLHSFFLLLQLLPLLPFGTFATFATFASFATFANLYLQISRRLFWSPYMRLVCCLLICFALWELIVTFAIVAIVAFSNFCNFCNLCPFANLYLQISGRLFWRIYMLLVCSLLLCFALLHLFATLATFVIFAF